MFGIVEAGLYRGSTPTPDNFSFLRQYGLRTAVVLSPEKLVPSVTDFFEENSIEVYHIGLTAWKPAESWKPVSDELIKEGLQIILDANTYPVMIMCSSGIHQTGTLVGCLRRLQTWNLTSTLYEYRMFTAQKNRFLNEQFIELFDLDMVTLPRDLPPWFLAQRQMLELERRDADGDDDDDDDDSGGDYQVVAPAAPPAETATATSAVADAGAATAGENAGSRPAASDGDSSGKDGPGATTESAN